MPFSYFKVNLSSQSFETYALTIKSYRGTDSLELTGLAEKSVTEIIQALSIIPERYTHLSLINNNLGSRNTNDIIKILQAIPSNVYDLDLSENNLDIKSRTAEDNRRILSSISKAVRYLKLRDFFAPFQGLQETVTHLSVNPYYFINRDKIEIEQILSTFPKVQYLNMSGFHFHRRDKLRVIPKSLQKLPNSIIHFDLSYNALFSDKNNLEHLPQKVKLLNLSHNVEERKDKMISGAALRNIPAHVVHVDLTGNFERGKDFDALDNLPETVREITLSILDLPMWPEIAQKLGQILVHVIKLNIVLDCYQPQYTLTQLEIENINIIRGQMGENVFQTYLSLEKNMTEDLAILSMEYLEFPAKELQEFIKLRKNLAKETSLIEEKERKTQADSRETIEKARTDLQKAQQELHNAKQEINTVKEEKKTATEETAEIKDKLKVQQNEIVKMREEHSAFKLNCLYGLASVSVPALSLGILFLLLSPCATSMGLCLLGALGTGISVFGLFNQHSNANLMATAPRSLRMSTI